MDHYNDKLMLKLAWQAAYEQRTCPPADLLYSSTVDGKLKKHLSFCESCRKNKKMTQEEKAAWQGLFDSMERPKLCSKRIVMQHGQIWILKKSLGGWQDDGRFFSPPMVLLLSKLGTTLWNVAQLYTDERLMGDGDIWLDDRFGFAQGWNTYLLRQEDLEKYVGSVEESSVSEVLQVAGRAIKVPVEGSIIWFFREMEMEVSSSMVLDRCSEQIHVQNNEDFLREIFGSLEVVFEKLVKFNVPSNALSLIELLSGVFDPQAISPVTASSNASLPVNIVAKQSNGEIWIKTVSVILSENNWEDGDYYVAGKLKEVPSEEMFFVASLIVNGIVIRECQSSVEKGSPYFDLVFRNVAIGISRITNLRFVLVKP